jgi:RecB family exonuclease
VRRIDHFLSQIQDGAWHTLKDLAHDSDAQEQKLRQLAELLAAPAIIEYTPEKDRIRISKRWQTLLEHTGKDETCGKAAGDKIALPPE